jgi:nicotinamide phosphoribosyltransferase
MGLAASTLFDLFAARCAAATELLPLLSYVGGDRGLAHGIATRVAGTNPIFFADMYKYGHHAQYPAGVTAIYEYFEPRVGAKDHGVVFFGLQFVLEELSGFRVSRAHVDDAASRLAKAFTGAQVFNEAGWRRIVDTHGGRLPLKICALPEGSVVPAGVPVMTVESTDPELPWLASWVESWLSHVWYTCTVASLSFHYLKVFMAYLTKEGFSKEAAYSHVRLMMIDFGMRGSTSMCSAQRGGAAVLTCFCSSDNTAAGIALEKTYGGCDAFFSVPATEHSVMTSFGPGDGEVEAFLHMIETYPTGILSIVSDSYDYENCLKKVVCGVLRDEIMQRYEKAKELSPETPHFVVIRPDSGDMVRNILMSLDALEKAYGSTKENGFKLLHPAVRLIQGDGINRESLVSVLDVLHYRKWSLTNLVFGSGGGLLQSVTRDTERFAMKASMIVQNGVEKNICKMTPGKQSKLGRLTVELDSSGEYVVSQQGLGNTQNSILAPRFVNGVVLNSPRLDDVRDRIRSFAMMM